ncbi:MAG: hypothetical protein NC935_08455 [Candidatus Omnitrophica bacterium]|nr:hypothetical protein [Candidatus Omnitrophota bacterium]
MKTKLEIILEKRDLLQKLSNLSFEYNIINRQYPLTKLNEGNYDLVIRLYDRILNSVINLAKTIQTKHENKDF